MIYMISNRYNIMNNRSANIHIENTEQFVKEINTLGFASVEATFDSYEIDEEYCQSEFPENFPNCCKYHESINDDINVWFKKFPNCCKLHKDLNKKHWFKKENYLLVPDKIQKYGKYTDDFIIKNLESEDWLETICDFIEYCYESFGQPNVGGYNYEKLVINYLKRHLDDKDITKEEISKINRLINHVEKHDKPIRPCKEKDLQLLQISFQKWIKTLPNINLFKDFKLHYENKVPLNLYLDGNGRVNRFTNIAKVPLKSTKELIDELFAFTQDFIKIIAERENNGDNKYKTDILNIIGEEHLLKQKKLFNNYSKHENQYYNLLKKWLFNEKEFAKEINNIVETNGIKSRSHFVTPDEIINQIYDFGINLEKYPKITNDYDEEGFRDYLLPHLNAFYKTLSVTGETFNKNGKTDILFQKSNGEISFIVECKLWKGEAQVTEALNQLFGRYVSWRVESCALVFFNKSTRNVKNVLKKINLRIVDHKLFNKKSASSSPTIFSYQFIHPQDESKTIRLDIILFNIF